MLLLTNPHNPLGVVYSAETISACVGWARKKGMHVVVDEIYAMSVHQVRGGEGEGRVDGPRERRGGKRLASSASVVY